MNKLREGLATLILAAGLALAGCGGGGQGTTGDADGVVRGVDRENAQITIEHEDIPGLMNAMTMDFSVAHPELLEGLGDGDEIHFEVRYENGSYTVTAIEQR